MTFRKLLLISALTFATPSLIIAPGDARGASPSSSSSHSSSPSFSRPSSSSSSPSFSRPSSSSRDSTTPSFSFSRPSSPSSSAPSSTVNRDSSGPSFSRPSSTPPAATATAPTGSSFSRPGSTTSTVSNRAPPSSALDKAVTGAASKNSLAAFDNDQRKYTAPPVAAPTNTQTARTTYVYRSYGTYNGASRWNSSDDYWAARRRAEASHPYVVPQYVQQGSPSYGGYAASFLGGMVLQNMLQPSYANWAYSHQNDPDVQRWHSDMQQKAIDDPELKAKLAQYDEQIAELKAKNAPVTDKLPDGVDPSEVVAPTTAMLATAQPRNHTFLYVVLSILGTLVVVAIGLYVLITWSQKRNRFA